MEKLIVGMVDHIAGRKVAEYLGIVRGVVVWSAGLCGRFHAKFADMGGGEVGEYTDTLADARRVAHSRMVGEAGERGANAILAVRYESNSIGEGLTEFLAYGTAVVLNG